MTASPPPPPPLSEGLDLPMNTTGKIILGSLSNHDADGDENGKKAIGLISKTTTLNAFFVPFFAVVARLQRESA